ILGHFPAIRLEPAVEIVELHAGRLANRPVKDLAGECLAERILAALLPAGDEVVSFSQKLKEFWNFVRIVLQVAIHGDNHIATCGCESMTEALSLPEVAAIAQANHTPVFGVEFLDDFPAAILRT